MGGRGYGETTQCGTRTCTHNNQTDHVEGGVVGDDDGDDDDDDDYDDDDDDYDDDDDGHDDDGHDDDGHDDNGNDDNDDNDNDDDGGYGVRDGHHRMRKGRGHDNTTIK